MTKLFDAKNTPADRDLRELHDELPELPEGVTVPDDLSGMTHPELTEPTGRRRATRWMRWGALGMLAVVGGAAIALAPTGDVLEVADNVTTSEATAEILTEGPGSHSLNVPVIVHLGFDPATDGPGSHSLDLPVVDHTPIEIVTDGPGTNTLNVPVVDHTPVEIVTDGPGTNTLNVPVVDHTPVEILTEGPGTHSLNIPTD